MTNLATYRGNNDTNGFSDGIWYDCPVDSLKDGSVRGAIIDDSFLKVPVLVTPTITTQANYGGGYKAFGSTGGTIVTAALPNGGGLVFTESDDNEGLSLNTIARPFQLDFGKGSFWFEAVLKTNEVANTKHGIFCGLIDNATLSATVPIAANGTLADQNFVGFHRLEADGDQIDTVYKADGVTQVTVKADALATALAADTFISLGMRFDAGKSRLTFLVNGDPLPDTKDIPSGIADGADFPNDVQMGMILALLCASADDAIVTLARWRGAQLAS